MYKLFFHKPNCDPYTPISRVSFHTDPSSTAVQGRLKLPCHFSTAWLLQIRTWIIKSGKKEKPIEKGGSRGREGGKKLRHSPRSRVPGLNRQAVQAYPFSRSCAWERARNKSDRNREERCRWFHVIWLLHLIEREREKNGWNANLTNEEELKDIVSCEGLTRAESIFYNLIISKMGIIIQPKFPTSFLGNLLMPRKMSVSLRNEARKMLDLHSSIAITKMLWKISSINNLYPFSASSICTSIWVWI